MSRTLLLCFIHGFKGNDDTFHNFPSDLKKLVEASLPGHNVESVVYPKYETKGELSQCSEAFLAWLKEKVMDIRKAHSEKPWPPHDRDVGVVLVAHSMGGFVAADTLLRILNERASDSQDASPMFPLIQGILTFDTPFNGLARSMFVYGAFSNYQKVSSVFNVMTALSAAPVAFSRLAFTRAASRLPSASRSVAGVPGWKAWQMVAVRTGTVGAIAAGGVAAYVHREKILDGLRGVRDLNRQSVKEGYHQGVDTLSQGLAYINRGNVGRSFAYLSDHFTFIGALMKQQELSRRLERMAALRGVGIHDFYVSLGENGVWSGGYFVPERTFCAVPDHDHQAYHLFTRQVVKKVKDEVEAHVSMFKPEKNESYDSMVEEASNLVVGWFNDDTELYDDPKFTTTPAPPEPVDELMGTTEDGEEVPKVDVMANEAKASDAEPQKENEAEEDDESLPDESPLDITAAASLVPLPDDDEEAPQLAHADGEVEARKTTYMRHLMRIAQQTGTDIRSYVPTTRPKLPDMPQMTIPSTSGLTSLIPKKMPELPTNLFGKKRSSPAEVEGEAAGVAREGEGGPREGETAPEETRTELQPAKELKDVTSEPHKLQ